MIIIRVVKFPTNSAKAFYLVDEDGNYNIYINETLDEPSREEALKHELWHIKNHDEERKEDIQRIEEVAHNRSKEIAIGEMASEILH